MVKGKGRMKELCLDLLRADTEDQVIDILRQAGYWDDPDVWRAFGDKEDNFSTMGNQSSNAEAALVEKLVNSVDAVLMGECMSAGISPNAPDAPPSIPEAVAQFFFNDSTKANTLGHISYWHDERRRELSQRITLAATGSPRKPSITVVDNGEGQTPEQMPLTLLSLDKKNKIDVHFVQGKFNMGGTGALRFCGQENLQLVISRKNPNIRPNGNDESADHWGFTIVRRENPTDVKKVSTYTYLAPDCGEVLRVDADSLPLYPVGNDAYARDTKWGTAIKLYEYKLNGRSHILRRGGLLQRLDMLLPRVALPIRLHECRNYGGNAGSFDTTLTGLGVRLSDDRGQNLEEGFPTGIQFSVEGERMTASIFAFKRNRASTYKRDEGIIFSVNGQTHGTLHRRFFARRAVGMGQLEDSILVVVDCSLISGRSREDLFMNSRDRLEKGEFLSAIEKELEQIVKDSAGLRELRERRRREDVATKLEDSKPLQDVLESIIKKSPSLASLFGGIGPLPNPFNVNPRDKIPFKGKQHPTFFRFKNKEDSVELHRETPVNMRSRIIFETDVENDNFDREKYGGEFVIRSLDNGGQNGSLPNYRLNLHDGVATLNLNIPKKAVVGDSYKYEAIVQDETLVEPFVRKFTVTVKKAEGTKPTPPVPPPTPSLPHGLAFPETVPVYEREWDKHGFSRDSALKVIYNPSVHEDGTGSYTYFINMDNVFLNTELKTTKENLEIVKSRWKFGMTLIGMSLLRNREKERTSNGDGFDKESELTPEELVPKITAAIAPALLPMIEHLGGLSEEAVGS